MSNLEIVSATHGIAPRSDELFRIGGDVERGRLDSSVFNEKLGQEQEEWLAAQQRAGIDFPESGKLRWQDHLRPIVKASEGFVDNVDNAPITRWFETNTFYRRPTIVGQLSFKPLEFETFVDPPGEYVSILAPYSFTRLVENQSTVDPTSNVYSLYEQLLTYYQAHGVKQLTLEEVFSSTAAERLLDIKAGPLLTALVEKFPDIQINHIETKNVSVPLPHKGPANLGLGVSNVTINHLYRHIPPSFRPDLQGKEIWQPVIDASNTAPDVIDATEWSREAYRHLHPARLVLTHSVDLQHIPLPYAHAKINRLGELALTLREYFEEEQV